PYSFAFFLVLCLAASPLAIAASNDFLPSNANVILLSGLAGDVESEREYREILEGWISLTGSREAGSRVFVLSDIDVDAKPSPLLQKSKATRADFLNLINPLSTMTNPLVVICWGHGGMQSQTPVFHVRGPRITAADFKTLADSAKGESQWLLSFSGSGKVARNMAGEHRMILSSDNESAFSSDPTMANFLLGKARGETKASFAEMAEATGKAILASYNERNLVASEEPTFWNGMEKSLQFAIGEAKIENTKSAKGATNQITGEMKNSKILPAYWASIKKVDPSDYPDDDAVILKSRKTYTIGSNPALSSEQEEFIQILKDEGKHLGDFDFEYSPPEQDIHFISCEILKPDGQVTRLNFDEIRDVSQSALSDYARARRKIFSMPDVGTGAILHVHFRTTWQTFPLPHVCTTIPILGEVPVVIQTVQVTVPAKTAFHFSLSNMEAPTPELKQSDYGSTYVWQLANLPARKHEILTPPGMDPKLSISTFTDWTDFSGWYERITKLADDITPEITERALSLTRNTKSEEEAIVAIYNYVTGLRYIAVEMGVNSFRPHSAANVLKNQFGDCKDKANLFNTLIRSLKNPNLDASLVLVPRFSQADPSTPGLSFNHAISQLRRGKEILWVDTTDDVCRFGMLPPGDSGRKALVIDGKSKSLTELPAVKPKDHRLTIRSRVDLQAPNEQAFRVESEVATLGFCDYELRSIASHTRAQAVNLPVLASRYKLVNGFYRHSRQTVSAVSSLMEPFHLEMKGSVGGVAIATEPTRKKISVIAPMWMPAEWELAMHDRRSGLLLNQGYPLELDEKIEFALPSGSAMEQLPPPQEGKEKVLQWKLEWSYKEPVLIAELHVSLESGELSASDSQLFQTQLSKLLYTLKEPAVFHEK
ncbi:MAG: hypothetical protein JWN25_735, partial [Verrucomicrobiales bacterium]|nr:hypothetical protein [Verrucomicrobiales bacterium]